MKQGNPETLPPKSVDELRALIVVRSLHFSEGPRRVTEEALRKPEIIAFGSVASIAKECSVSRSTVVRLSALLGFESTRDFRAVFRNYLRERNPG